jgi:hypothetical protein
MPQSGHLDTEDRQRTLATAVSDLVAEELAQRAAELDAIEAGNRHATSCGFMTARRRRSLLGAALDPQVPFVVAVFSDRAPLRPRRQWQ